MTANRSFHQQLVDQLHALVRDGGFAPGTKFLTEREVADRFHTSRPTANKALCSLVSAGVLEVRRGVGTFVRDTILEYDLERLVSFTDKAKAAGKKPGTQLLDYRCLTAAEAPDAVTAALRVSGETPLVYMERIRLAEGSPVIYERRHVAALLCPGMTKSGAKGSLYACWTEICGLSIAGADEVIRAVNANEKEAALLQIPPASACFLIVAIGYVEGGAPLWREETLYRADCYEFRNRIGGISGSRAALGRIVGAS